MKKVSYLIVLALILGLVLTGCFLSNVGQVPTTEQSGITYLTKNPSPSGLVGLWHFDGDADDSSGYDNDGIISGATYAGSANAMFGDALNFDGTNDYVEIASAPSLNITQGTWEAWIKFDAKPSDAGHPMNPLAKANQYWIHGSKNDPDSGTTDAIVAKICVGGTRYFATTDSDFIEEDVWYHVAGTYDGETLKLYVNGTLVDSNPAPSGNIDTGTQIMAVGTWSMLVDYSQGTIDEVRIWNTALTVNQIQQSMESPLPVIVTTNRSVPDSVEVNVAQAWDITITVCNYDAGNNPTDVVVQGGIGADLVVTYVGEDKVDPPLDKKETRIYDDVTLIKKGGKMGATIVRWDIDTLSVGECLTSPDLKVQTGKNPAGKQEFTSEELDHELDGGFSATYLYNGIEYKTPETEPLTVDVIPIQVP